MTAAILLVAAVLHGLVSAPAETPAPMTPAAQRQAQERARAMARELVTSVLDLQLTKLEVNGLDKLPIYGEIKAMRKNIDRLIEIDMAEVTNLLAQADGLPAAEKAKKYEAIREKTRSIVVRLSIERQNLLRRLKLADTAAQIRRLLEMQTANLRRTESLNANQAAQTLTTIQDERDIKALYGQLHNLVREVSAWGGIEGAAAADGLRILRAARVSDELDRSIASLEEVKFTDAASSEKAVIRGLAALLEKIDEARGVANSDIEALLKEVAHLTKRQEELKQKTKTENLNDKAAEAILQEQAKLHKDLDKLDEGLKRVPGAETPLRQAKAAAYEATANLFAAKQPEAVQEQDKVLANLAKVTEQLKKAANEANTAKSADELARLAEHLKKARDAVNESEPHQRKAFDKNAKADGVKDDLVEIAKRLAKAHSEPMLPPQVAARIQEAKEAVEKAKDKADPEALKEAKDATERAMAEVNAAAAETERRQLAVKIGELGRAAEALERAAAHQRDLSDKAAEVAKKDGFTPAEAKELHEEQKEVAKVAAKTAEAVKNTAPKAADQLTEAAKPIQKAEAALADKQTPKAADAVAKEAHAASKQLEQAAAKIRDEIKETAKDLVKVADQQLGEIGEVAKDVDKARADLPAADSDKMEDLAKAKKLIAEARTEQQRAQGQEKAAKQRELARKIAEAMEQQENADKAAKDLMEGKNARTVDAAAAQQKAADDIAELSKEAKANAAKDKAANDKAANDKGAEHLDKAEKAAAKAAKDLLDGKPHQAEAARKEARDALDKARQEAQAQAEKHAGSEEGKPNADAQKRVSDLAKEAGQMAKDEAPAAAKQLEKAGDQSKEAEKKLAAGDKAQPAQKNAENALRDAEQQIDKAMKDLAQRQLDQKADKGEQVARAADKSAKVDPDALAALRDAEKNAKSKDGDQEAKANPPQTPRSVKEMRRNLDNAATALDNRKNQAERDKALAEDVGRAAAEQQKARDQIEATAQEMAQEEKGKTDKTDPKDAKAQAKNAKMANDLRKAMNEFADTQRRIGENAKEISRQEEVANKPLREALEGASKLAKPQDEAKTDNAANPEAKTGNEGDPQAKNGDHQGKNGDKNGDPKNGDHQGKNGDKNGDPKNGDHQGKNGDHQGKGNGGQPKNGDLGTGLVPASPEQTAQMIAGQQAAAKAGQGQSQSGQQAGNPNQSQTGSEANQANQSNNNNNSNSQNSQNSQQSKNSTNASRSTQGNQSGNTSATRGGADSTAKSKSAQDEAWMAKLPPELRKAIKANSQQSPPRGYEELLRRYFRDE